MREAKSPFLSAAVAPCVPRSVPAAWMRCRGRRDARHPWEKERGQPLTKTFPTQVPDLDDVHLENEGETGPGVDVHLENEGETQPGLPGWFSWRCGHALEQP